MPLKNGQTCRVQSLLHPSVESVEVTDTTARTDRSATMVLTYFGTLNISALDEAISRHLTRRTYDRPIDQGLTQGCLSKLVESQVDRR